jgi:hypothetical protein
MALADLSRQAFQKHPQGLELQRKSAVREATICLWRDSLIQINQSVGRFVDPDQSKRTSRPVTAAPAVTLLPVFAVRRERTPAEHPPRSSFRPPVQLRSDGLAANVQMSVFAFHHHFRQITNEPTAVPEMATLESSEAVDAPRLASGRACSRS